MARIFKIAGAIIILLLLAWVGWVAIYAFRVTFSPQPLGSGGSSGFGSGSGAYEFPAVDYVTLDEWDCEPRSSYVAFTGRAKNEHASRSLSGVALRVRIEDERGRTINNNAGYVDSDVIWPGDTATFRIHVDDPEGEADQCYIQVEGAEFTNR